MVYLATRLNRIFRTIFVTCILFLLLSSITLASNYPSPTNNFYVNDFSGVLDNQAKQYIESNAATVEQLTSAQVVVVTVNDLGDSALEDYALGLFREWGIGDKQANNGVLILVDIGGRQSRIEIGYGLEGALPDGKTGRIQDNFMIPYFQKGNYSLGIVEGFNAIVNEIYIEYGYEDRVIGDYIPITDQKSTEEEQAIPSIFRLIGIIVLIILIILDFKFTGGAFTFMILRGLGRGGSGHSHGSRRSGGGGSGGGGGSSRKW